MQKNRGFVLVLTVFLVVILSMAVATSFLNSGARARSSVRTAQHIQMLWAAEALMDKAVQLVNERIMTAGLPGDTTLIGFNTALQTWYGTLENGFRGRHTGITKWIKLNAVAFEKTREPDLMNADYQVKVTLEHEALGAKRLYSQDLHVTIGRIFDYSVFYEKDLEIAPGPDWELQGPIFSNSNIYLMTGKDKTLTLTMPPVGSTPEQYALKSYRNIYFGFKTAVAKNPLLDPKDPAYNAYYGSVFPAALKNPQHIEYHSLGGDPLKPGEYPYANPYNYVFSNDSLYQWGSASTILVKRTFGDTEPLELIKPKTQPNHPIYFFLDSYENRFFAQDRPNGAPVLTVFSTINPYLGQYGHNISLSSGVNPGSPRMLRENWTPQNPECDPPFPNPNWKGLKDPSGNFLVVDKAADSGVQHKTIPVGDPENSENLHQLIEPVSENDSESLEKHKYQTYANVLLKCSTAQCAEGAYKAYYRATSANGPDGYPIEILLTDIGASFLAADFYDYRLGGAYRTLQINLSILKDYMEQTRDIKKVVLYIETNPLAPGKRVSTSNAPDLVKLKNGAKLPSGGLSVITNGRLWVQGDYNTVYDDPDDPDSESDITCDSDMIKQGTCAAPSADLYSDSFGVLSNDWGKAGSATEDELAAVSLTQRPVTADTILNAAVITGSLPSQLVLAKYVSCCNYNADYPVGWNTGVDKYVSDCAQMTSDPAAVAKCSIRNTVGGDFYSCPEGLDEAGKPKPDLPDPVNNPDNLSLCHYRRDATQNGVVDHYILNKESLYFSRFKEFVGKLENNKTFDYFSGETRPPLKEYFEYSDYLDEAGDLYQSDRALGQNAQKVYKVPDWAMDGAESAPLPLVAVADDQPANYNIYPDFKPLATNAFPGIAHRILLSDRFAVDPKYTCWTDYHNVYRKTKILNPQGEATGEYAYPQIRRDLKCVCDEEGKTYSVSQHDVENFPEDPTKMKYVRGYAPGVEHPTTDASGDPIDAPEVLGPGQSGWKKSDYLGSGVCPNVEDNYFEVYPKVAYGHDRYYPIWIPRYSGGLENLINFQEDWRFGGTPWPLHFSGSLIVPWDSLELYQITQPGSPAAFYKTDYYAAPKRDFNFNPKLRDDTPPLLDFSNQQLFSVTRRGFEEKAE